MRTPQVPDRGIIETIIHTGKRLTALKSAEGAVRILVRGGLMSDIDATAIMENVTNRTTAEIDVLKDELDNHGRM